ncbi:MAG TPA: sigma-70 family RNA polymerase sigma factor [Acidimicrobiales bacterium]|nr:sigma-70 family RNA polymerase sigma factor [Acidimicrobiales bacterium]
MARVGLPADRMADEALLAGLSAGGPDVGLAFVRRFQRQVYGVALAVVGDPTLAEDVAQQAFIRAWKAAPAFDPRRGSVRTWLTTIAHNLAIDATRGRKATPLDPSDLVRLIGAGADEPEAWALREESAGGLRRAIRDLPAEQGRAIVMAGVYGLTAHEVAESEGIPLGTAKTRIRSAMTKLRAALDPSEVDHG